MNPCVDFIKCPSQSDLSCESKHPHIDTDDPGIVNVISNMLL